MTFKDHLAVELNSNITVYHRSNFCSFAPLLSTNDFELCNLQPLVTKQDGSQLSYRYFATTVQYPPEMELAETRGCSSKGCLLLVR